MTIRVGNRTFRYNLADMRAKTMLSMRVKHKLEDGTHGETLVGMRAKILLAMCMKGKSENDAHANKWRNSEIYHAFWVSLGGTSLLPLGSLGG